jgi:hypothetical protein
MFATSGLSNSRFTRLVLVVSATAGLFATIAAAPSASIGKESSPAAALRAGVEKADASLRPLGRGPALRVGRAFSAEDEDCTLVVTRTPDAAGQMRVRRAVSCAN